MKSKGFVILARDAFEEIIENLSRSGWRVYLSAESLRMDPRLRFHPDLQMHPVGSRRVVVSPDTFDYYGRLLERESLELLKGRTEPGMAYPNDVPYNVGRIGGYAVHRLDVTDPVISDEYERINMQRLGVGQGYTGCSLLSCGGNVGLTSDEGIFKTLSARGLELLLIPAGDIALPGFPYGFIGGAGGSAQEGTVYLTGALRHSGFGGMVRSFLTQRKIRIVELSDRQLTDFGKIFFFTD